MKRILLILLVVLIALTAWDIARSMRRARDKLWIISAVKAPGRMALEDIEADLYAGRTDLAKAKLSAFRKQWAAFDTGYEFQGPGIGNIMRTFYGLDQAAAATNTSAPNASEGRSGVTTVVYTLNPFRTFRFSSRQGIDLSELRAALVEHHAKNPTATYELWSQAKSTPDGEKAIVDVFNKAGVKLLHYWAPVSDVDLGAPSGPHGPGHVDVLRTTPEGKP